MLGLEDVRNELATGLPYGLQRRVEIARALATEPKLLLDEPAAGMNPQETEELTAFIDRISLSYMDFSGCVLFGGAPCFCFIYMA